MIKKRSIGINAVLNSVRSIFNILFPIITFPYVSRVLGVKGIGIYNFSNSMVSYFVLIAGLGINIYAVREGAKIRDNRKKINKFSSEIFTINMLSTVLSYVLLFITVVIFAKLHSYIACISIFSLQIIFTTIGTEWIYQIYEDYTYITLRSIIFQCVSLILLFVFVRNKQDYLNYAAISVFSTVGSNILNFFYARKYCTIRLVWNFKLKKHIIPILIIFGVNIASLIYVNSDITLLGLIKNSYIVGIYSVSSKIYQIVKTLIAALLIVTVPRLAMLFGKHELKKYKEILSKLTNTLVLLVLPSSVGLFMLAKEVVLIISGKNYLKSVSSLRILCFAYIFSILAWILTDCVLIPSKREKKVLISTSISAFLNIILNLLFVPFWNENAAAFSTVCAEICMLLLNYKYSKDIVSKIFSSIQFRKNIITSIIGCVGIISICILCDYSFQSLIIKTILSIILSVIIYGAILVLLNNEVAVSILARAKMFLKDKL